MTPAAKTTGIALSVLLCLVAAGFVAQVVMGAGPYLLIYLLGLREDWQMTAAVAVAWLVALAPIVAVVSVVARALAGRGDSTAGIMLGVAAYPAVCLALVVLTPEAWMEVRWAGFGHGFVAVPVAIGVAIIWMFIRPARPAWGRATLVSEGEGDAPRLRPVS